MKFGISNNVKSRVVRECTPELLRQALDSPLVARVCAEIEDALEAVRRGEMSKDDFETLKAARKKMLPVITPHATFKNGRRLNADAVPSGLSMYDVDHINDPRAYYDTKVRGREAELGIVLAHVTPSTEGLRLLFVIPRAGMAPDEAQRWMSVRLGDAAYDGAVKDLARCSFLVPREYVLYLDEEKLFNEELRIKNEEWPADGENSSFGGEADILHSSLPKRLPALIKLLVSRTPDVYKAAVAHAVFPSLAAHLHRVRFKYIDNVEHEATLMNVLMAGTGAGKDCISEPINRIMADIRRRDEDNLRREREWKNEVTSKGANKDKRQRPEGLIIQEIDADMTNPAFVMRMAEADGHFLYTKLNEIDQFDALRGSGRSGQQFQIMCLAFDPGNRYGQTRVGVQSVTEKVTIRFNWNASTTIQKGKRYFSRVLTDGPISRINFCTIPEREIGADMPVYGTYDAAFDEELRPYIENLVKAQGLIDCPQAYKLAQTLKEECADFARLSQSRVYENLSFRANVIAYLKACVLFVANGCRWDKTFEDFIRWSLRYDLACKMEFFGADIESAMSEVRNEGKRHGRVNLLTLLPDEFTHADVVRVRQSQGMDAEGTRNMLWQWTHRHYITKLTIDNKQIYQKTEQWK